MGTITGIAWADATWNPWIGCSKVSEGCDNCYMFRQQEQRHNDPRDVHQTKPPRIDLPRRKHRDGSWQIPSGSFVFVCSWSDFFHEDVPDEWRRQAFGVMQQRPDLTFLILTKRPNAMRDWVNMLAREWAEGSASSQEGWLVPHRHIWLGVTAENQRRADERIDILRHADWPGKRFVSIEPQIGAIDLSHYLTRGSGVMRHPLDGLDWVICGGESGPSHRPFDLDWARTLRDQCQAAAVPFFLKQYSGNRLASVPMLDGKWWTQRPEMLVLNVDVQDTTEKGRE